jgi:hypothetical protein
MSSHAHDTDSTDADGGCNLKRFGGEHSLVAIELIMLAGIVAIAAAFVYEAIRISNLETLARSPLDIPGFIEADNLRVVKKEGDFAILTQDTASFRGRWSEQDHLFVCTSSAGQSISLKLPDTDPGSYLVQVYLTKSWDYGIVQLYINGKKVGPPIDLWSPAIESTGPLLLGKVVLKGANDIVLVEVTGKNKAASQPFYQFGIDGFVLQKTGL